MKKVNTDFWDKPRWLFRCMVTFVVLLLAASVSMAQGSARVNIDQKNATLSEVFEQVRRQTSLSVLYSNDDISNLSRKDYVILDATVEQAMKHVLVNTGLEYELTNNVIVIRQAPVAKTATQIPATEMAAQTPTHVIKGKIRGENGIVLPGATVVNIATGQGVVSDMNGNFEIRVTSGSAPVIRIAYMGYQPQDITFRGVELNVVLQPALKEISEVIVTGIFDRVADSYTGSVRVIKKEALERVGNQNLIQSLRNLDPTFQVLESMEYGADPNRLPDIQMRGASNFSDMRDRYQTSPNQPLFVIDGFETTLQKVMDMDMSRIASTTLLKDAAAKALYGSKGANGVVVIETVAPEIGRLKVTYTADFTVTTPDLSSYNLSNAAEKLEIERRSGKYSSSNPAAQQLRDEEYNMLYNEVLRGVDTYWLDVPLRTGFGHKHSIYLEGGDDVIRYSFDFGYNNIQGVMKGSGRENITGAFNFQYRYKNFLFRDQVNINFNTAKNSPYGDYSEYSRLNPYWRSHNEDGSIKEIVGIYAISNSQGYHPIYNPMVNASLNTINSTGYLEFTNNFYAEWQAFEGMRLKGRFGILAQRNESDVFLPRDHSSFRDITIDSEDYFNRGRYTLGTGKTFDYNADISANYSKIFNEKHVLFANAQFSISEKKNDMLYLVAEGFANNKMDYITHAKRYPQTGGPSGIESLSREISFVASVNYSYDERYLLDATIRTNASSLFGSDKRWGTFWSAGIGWNIHKEKFMEDNSWMERLRLRASTGFSGAQNFNSYQALATYKYYNVSYDNIIGAYQLAMANPDLKWQRTQDHNIGFDISFLKRFDVTFDFYIKNTYDMLTPVTMPPSSGFNSYTENLGQMKNTGFEARLNYRVISDSERQIYFSVFASGMHNKNKLVKISDALTSYNDEKDQSKGNQGNQDFNHETNKHMTKPSIRYQEGQSMDAIWAVRSYGINPTNGKEVFLKNDGTLTYAWDPNDQVVIGNSLPKFSGTFGFNFEYKGFTINTSFFFRGGGQYYNQTLVDKVENADIQYNVDRRMYTDRWSKENAGKPAKFKAFHVQAGFTRPTSRFVQNLNELQMTSLNIGYDFRNLGFVKNTFVERLKVQVYCNDLFRASTVKTERGTQYPFARTFSLKIQATF